MQFKNFRTTAKAVPQAVASAGPEDDFDQQGGTLGVDVEKPPYTPDIVDK